MTTPISNAALDQLFVQARTHNAWQPRAVSDEQIHHLYDLLKWGPTSANCCPARFIFIKSAEQKEKLKPFLMESNVDKTMQAPVTVIIAQDLSFHDKLPQLFPHADAKSWFDGNDALIQHTALRDTSLQSAYLIMAARSLGLDCGPMAGFDAAAVDTAFFAGTNFKTIMLVNLGYGEQAKLFPRSPRFSFDEACKIV